MSGGKSTKATVYSTRQVVPTGKQTGATATGATATGATATGATATGATTQGGDTTMGNEVTVVDN